MAEHLYRTRRRHSAVGLTERKRRELLAIANAWHLTRDKYIDMLWDLSHTSAVIRRDWSLVREQFRRGWLPSPLGGAYSRLALDSAMDVLSAQWKGSLRRVRDRVGGANGLTPVERHWCRYVLRWPDLVQLCALGGPVHVEQEWATGVDERRLARWLRKLILRHRGSKPAPVHAPYFYVNTNLYRAVDRSRSRGRHKADRHFRGAWLAIASMRPRKRILVPLAGRSLDEFTSRTHNANSRPELRIEVRDRVIIYMGEKVPRHGPNQGPDLGVDKGYRALLTVSSGSVETSRTYGDAAHAEIARVADAATERLRQRRRLVSYERSIRNTDTRKAKRIRRNNLRGQRSRRQSRREKATLKQQVNRALNEMFASERSSRLHVEELNFSGAGSVSKQAIRRLRRWLKGYLHERMGYKAELNGVELNVVNAAYTSQACPRCWFTSRSNRHAGKFECRDCGYTGSADAVAATNVLRRGSDPAITRRTSLVEVRQTLAERWRAARSGRAWGSNAHDPEGQGVAGAVMCASREQSAEHRSASTLTESSTECGYELSDDFDGNATIVPTG